MLVMPKKASKSAQDFWSLYNSKIFNANKKDKVVKIIGANEKIRDWEKSCEIKNNNHAITFNFRGLKDEDEIKEFIDENFLTDLKKKCHGLYDHIKAKVDSNVA